MLLSSLFRFRQVQSWMSRVKASARECGYVLTLNGRRRYIDNIKSTHHNERAYAERQAVNSIVQVILLVIYIHCLIVSLTTYM